MRTLKVFLILTSLLLSGCAAMSGMKVLDAVNPLKEDKGIDATAQVGKNNTSVKNKALVNVDSETHAKTDNQIQAEKVDQIANYKDAPWLIIAFAIMAGFAIPNPFTYFANRKHIKDQKEVIHGLREQLTQLHREASISIIEAGRAGAERTKAQAPGQATNTPNI